LHDSVAALHLPHGLAGHQSGRPPVLALPQRLDDDGAHWLPAARRSDSHPRRERALAVGEHVVVRFMNAPRFVRLALCSTLPLAVGLLAGGCIGVTAKPPPGAGAPIKKCSGDPFDAPDGLIDDFEDGNTVIAAVAGREGYWFKSADAGGSFFGPEDIGPVPG